MFKQGVLLPFLLFFLFAPETSICNAQDSLQYTYTDISKIEVGEAVSKFVSSAYTTKDIKAGAKAEDFKFRPGLQHNGTVPNNYVTKKILLRFNVHNSADSSVTVYFFPGFYYQQIVLYKVENNSLQPIPVDLPQNPDSLGYRGITLPAFDSATIIAELSFLKTYINTIRPRLINKKHISSFMADLRSKHEDDNLVTYVFCGLLLMMILFSIANFFQGANPEFLYYSGYALFLGAMLFIKALFDFRMTRASYFQESYLDFILQCTGIIFYMIFMKIFLETKKKYSFLYKLYNLGVIILVASIIGYSYLHFLTDNFVVENMIENYTKIFLLIMIVIFLLYSLKHWKDKLLRYLFWGNFFLLLFSVISFVAVIKEILFKNIDGILSSSLFYYEIGLFLELVFFLTALNHKNNKRLIEQTKERESLKALNKLKEYEKEIAVYKAQQAERERISADMHDELGSGMTAIRLMSEIARNKMKENTPVEIDKISSSADDVLNKMNAIIWSMNSGNDTLDNLLSYIRIYALEYFESTPVNCSVNIPELIPDKELSGDKRRNIFLSLKETLNNVLKHAEATSVSIKIETNQSLKIIVTDNGKGIDFNNIRQFGNGLNNMKRRMESIGGSFIIENENGTRTTLELPL